MKSVLSLKCWKGRGAGLPWLYRNKGPQNRKWVSPYSQENATCIGFLMICQSTWDLLRGAKLVQVLAPSHPVPLPFSLLVFSGSFHLTHKRLVTFSGGSEGSAVNSLIPEAQDLFQEAAEAGHWGAAYAMALIKLDENHSSLDRRRLAHFRVSSFGICLKKCVSSSVLLREKLEGLLNRKQFGGCLKPIRGWSS